MVEEVAVMVVEWVGVWVWVWVAIVDFVRAMVGGNGWSRGWASSALVLNALRVWVGLMRLLCQNDLLNVIPNLMVECQWQTVAKRLIYLEGMPGKQGAFSIIRQLIINSASTSQHVIFEPQFW